MSLPMLKKYSLFFFLLICSSLGGVHSSIIKEEFIFTNPPFASCHASTLTQTDSGLLLCSWFGGSEEGASDVAIWLSILDQGEWSFPRKVAAANGVPCWNPVLFTMPSNELLLFYKAGKNPQQWSGFLKRSCDEGINWSEEKSFPAGVIGPVKNKPLLLQDGTLLCGSSIESWMRWGCWIDITSDNCQSWSKSTPINVKSQLFGIIQPTIFFAENGLLKLLARSHQIGFICIAQSQDQGKSWSPAKPTTLPNPNSAIDAVNIADGRILVVYNHSKENRYPLNVAISKDGGETWKMKVILEEGPGEYSYPSAIQSKDGKIHITYTWNRTKIKHVVLDPSLL
ncbi:MAG: exo-alpha-sialidase [Chlamydiae bacterium]|nr:exo-alpha-sialidase [Chlamydiota bacterium]